MKRIALAALASALWIGVAAVVAQDRINVVGTGETGTIQPGETVSGTLELSDASTLSPISYVGHNGANRQQGDFDAWRFEADSDENFVIEVIATDGDLVPTLLIIRESDSIPTVSAWDSNADGDSHVGVCLPHVSGGTYVILASRQPETEQTGSYELTLTSAAEEELGGGSETATCRVGTFVATKGTRPVNIRSNPGTQYDIIGQMQPGEPYTYYSGGTLGWLQIMFYREGFGVWNGYVRADLVALRSGAELSSFGTP
jgi:hypothetical protein